MPLSVCPLAQLPLIIGRGTEAQLQIDDDRFDVTHFRIDGPSGRQVTDLGSLNGTLHGDRRLSPNISREWLCGQAVHVLDWRFDLIDMSSVPATSNERIRLTLGEAPSVMDADSVTLSRGQSVAVPIQIEIVTADGRYPYRATMISHEPDWRIEPSPRHLLKAGETVTDTTAMITTSSTRGGDYAVHAAALVLKDGFWRVAALLPVTARVQSDVNLKDSLIPTMSALPWCTIDHADAEESRQCRDRRDGAAGGRLAPIALRRVAGPN